MKVLVTGGCGFIGSHTVDMLVEQGHQVVVVDNLLAGDAHNLNSQAEFYKVDITSDELKNIFQKFMPEVVYHLAAQIDIQKSIKEVGFDAHINILGTINVLDCCRAYRVGKIIYASSAAVYGNPQYLGVDELHPINPISFYGISKHTPEHYIMTYSELYGIGYTILRYSNAYGPRQDPKGEGGVISIFIDKMLKGIQPTIFGDGEQTRDFIYVRDVALANLAALKTGEGDIINVSTNTAVTVNQLFSTMRSIINFIGEPIYGPVRKGDIIHSYLDNDKALRVLSWKPQFTIEEGLRETMEYYCQKQS